MLFADHDARTVMIGKNPITAKTAIKPRSISATTQPGATGINATKAAAAPTNISGDRIKMGLSAFAGMIISFVTSFIPSAIS